MCIPNPVTLGHHLSVKLFLPENGHINLTISDMMGKVIYQFKGILLSGEHKLTFDHLPLSQGIYSVSIDETTTQYMHQSLISVSK